MKKTHAILLSLAPAIALAQTAAPDRFVGEVGAMGVTSNAIVNGASSKTSALPYVYGDWGRFYARVDTLGVKLLPMGEGHLELAMRVSTEGYQASKTANPDTGDRSAPLPIGVGTFQRTALGGVFAYAMHDPRSGGQFAELNWAGRLDLGSVKLYPQLGAQYRSASYVRHLYGISSAQALASGLSEYRPGSSLSPMATLQASVPLQGPWALQLQARYRWLGDAVAQSPLVKGNSQVSGFAALTYTLN
jgi:outer membrane protein